MTKPDIRPGARVTFKKDYSFTPENIAKHLGIFISSPEQLPPIDREQLTGKVAVVTGSTRGIGEATARLFAEFGVKVVVNGRPKDDRESPGIHIAQDIVAKGGEAIFFAANVSKPEQADALVDAVVKQFGRIDILVNNIGTRKDNLVVLMKPEQVYEVVETNLYSTVFASQAAAKRMMRNRDPKGGVIINVSSVGEAGFPGQAIYAATKRGGEAVMDVMAQEYASREIYTSIIKPGLTDTDLVSDLTPEQRAELLKLPAGRALQPEEIARGILYLATLKESGHVLTMA